MSLSNSDIDVTNRIQNIVFPEKKPAAQAPVEAAPEPIRQEAPEAADDGGETQDQADDTGADEGDYDAGDEDTGREDDAGSEPSVTPPSGLTADELDAFRDLSPAAQKAWARRDQDRAKELARVQTRLAERDKEHATAMQEIATERQRLAQAATQFGDQEIAAFQAKFSDITDPAKLAADDPMRFLEFQGALQKLQFAQAQKQQLQQQAQAERHQNLVKFRQAENEKFRDLLSIKDDAAFTKVDENLSQFLVKKGFKEDHIVAASANELMMAYNAMRWEQAQASRKTVEAKRTDIPQVQRPGTKRDVDVDATKEAALRKRLKQSGGIDDAAAVISRML